MGRQARKQVRRLLTHHCADCGRTIKPDERMHIYTRPVKRVVCMDCDAKPG